MPYLRIEANVDLEKRERQVLLARASALIARELGKPERYVMISLETAKPMCFAGNDQPLAYLELKSIGLPVAQTPALAKTLCALIEEILAIPTDRTYITFSDIPRQLWGWNGSTF